MGRPIEQLEQIPTLWFQAAFFAAAAFVLFMALIPGGADPTGFINDKLKHIITFFVLCAMLDLAFPTEELTFWKPASLLLFGVVIEVLQKMTGYRDFSVGDIAANCAGIAGYTAAAYIISMI